ncbi:MAG: hypothetical protein ACLFRG_12560 [Desulfococcaceae bacterium]
MDIAEEIYREVRRMPADAARKVLDFIEHLRKNSDFSPDFSTDELRHLKAAQSISMDHLWDNEADDVWDDDPTR